VSLYSKERLEYRKAFLRLYQKKYPQIRILVGGEIDIYEGGKLTLPTGIDPSHFDYLLVSKHFTLPINLDYLYRYPPMLEQWIWTHNPRLILNKEMWFRGIHANFHKDFPDIFAHPQWNMPKNMMEADYKRLAWLAMKYHVAVELNPQFRKNLRRMLDVLSKYRDRIKFSLGSDFHGREKDMDLVSEANLSQEMYEMAQEYQLNLIDPHIFLPENRHQYLQFREARKNIV
jgi:histidinol phosphatase-like PHP family hydrolase